MGTTTIAPGVGITSAGCGTRLVLSVVGRDAQRKTGVMIFPRLYLANCAYRSLFLRRHLLRNTGSTLVGLMGRDTSLSTVFFIKLPFRVLKGLCGITTIFSRKRILKLMPGDCLPGCGRFCRTERFMSKTRLTARIILPSKDYIPTSQSLLFIYRRVPGLEVNIRLYRSL